MQGSRGRPCLVSLLAIGLLVCTSGPTRAAEDVEPPAPPEATAPPEAPAAEEAPAAPEAPAPPEAPATRTTPPRLSFFNGEVSFWRPGAEDWAPAHVNTPLAAGDSLYAGQGANLELQAGPRAYVRAGGETDLGLEDVEPDFQQLKVTAGHVALDLRSLERGHTVELDTPHLAVTIEQAGYYRADVDDEATTFSSRRGGRASVVPAGGEALDVGPNEEAIVKGTESPQVERYAAPKLDAWDRWNYERSDQLLNPKSARYLPEGVSGGDDLDHYGRWHTEPDYGAVWVPSAVPAGWVPYSTGRWIWDPFYGWTWVDDAPWGWAPFHYGRWVFAGGVWGWAPGPIVVAPVYAPALVAFFGGSGVSVSVGLGVPVVSWVALGWGEPCIPWWGPPAFIGVPWWGGWGGPRVVNNVIIQRTTIIHANQVNIFRNARLHNAIVGVRRDDFGRGVGKHFRLGPSALRHLNPVRGVPPVRPTPASLVPGRNHARRPPEHLHARQVVATRAPRDHAAPLRAVGLNPGAAAPPPRLVAPPRARARAEQGPAAGGVHPGARPHPGGAPRVGGAERPAPPAHGRATRPGSGEGSPPAEREARPPAARPRRQPGEGHRPQREALPPPAPGERTERRAAPPPVPRAERSFPRSAPAPGVRREPVPHPGPGGGMRREPAPHPPAVGQPPTGARPRAPRRPAAPPPGASGPRGPANPHGAHRRPPRYAGAG